MASSVPQRVSFGTKSERGKINASRVPNSCPRSRGNDPGGFWIGFLAPVPEPCPKISARFRRLQFTRTVSLLDCPMESK